MEKESRERLKELYLMKREREISYSVMEKKKCEARFTLRKT